MLHSIAPLRGSVFERGVPQGKESVTEVSVTLEDQPFGTISHRLHGHFDEHLGRCCHGGPWVGDPDVPERVSPWRLAVEDSRAGKCTVTMPTQSMATIEFATNGVGRD
jgi:hypothetical protein